MLIASKLALFFGVRFERRKVDKKQTYMKTETCKLYSRDFRIFLPKIIKIDLYNSELYRFKVGAFFETQCRYGFHRRQIEWRYFRFDQIQDGSQPPSWKIIERHRAISLRLRGFVVLSVMFSPISNEADNSVNRSHVIFCPSVRPLSCQKGETYRRNYSTFLEPMSNMQQSCSTKLLNFVACLTWA